MIDERAADPSEALRDTLVFALPDGGEWQQLTYTQLKSFNNFEGECGPLPGFTGPVRFVLFIVRDGHAVNAIPHYVLLDENGYPITSLSLDDTDAKRTHDLLWIEIHEKREMTATEQAEYNELGEKGYRAALPDREAIRRLIRILPVPIDSDGGIRSFVALAGLDPAMFDCNARPRVM